MAKKGRKGKARRSGGRRKGSSRKGASRGKTFTINAANVAAGGAMLLMLNADKVAGRALALANRQTTIQEAAVGAVSDVYAGAKQNTVQLMAVPIGLGLARKLLPKGRSLKVPGIPLRIRGL